MNFEEHNYSSIERYTKKGTILRHCVRVKAKEKIHKIQYAQGLKFILHKMEVNMA